MESTLKEMRDGASVLDMDPKSTVGGGAEDVYGEDCATEDHLVTPWTVSVARYRLVLQIIIMFIVKLSWSYLITIV